MGEMKVEVDKNREDKPHPVLLEMARWLGRLAAEDYIREYGYLPEKGPQQPVTKAADSRTKHQKHGVAGPLKPPEP